MLFLIAVGVMILILWATGGQRSRWWAPIVTGTLSAVWGLGFVGVMGYDFDPVMLVIPFILTARDMSHGIQWQGRYHDELDRLGDKFAACAATTDFMLPPGLLSILADISGIVFISFGGIPVLQHIALAGTVWLAGSLTMVFIFQPILMSYLPIPEVKHQRAKSAVSQLLQGVYDFLEWFVHVPTRPGTLRKVLLWGSRPLPDLRPGCRPRLQNRLFDRRARRSTSRIPRSTPISRRSARSSRWKKAGSF